MTAGSTARRARVALPARDPIGMVTSSARPTPTSTSDPGRALRRLLVARERDRARPEGWAVIRALDAGKAGWSSSSLPSCRSRSSTPPTSGRHPGRAARHARLSRPAPGGDRRRRSPASSPGCSSTSPSSARSASPRCCSRSPATGSAATARRRAATAATRRSSPCSSSPSSTRSGALALDFVLGEPATSGSVLRLAAGHDRAEPGPDRSGLRARAGACCDRRRSTRVTGGAAAWLARPQRSAESGFLPQDPRVEEPYRLTPQTRAAHRDPRHASSSPCSPCSSCGSGRCRSSPGRST